QSLLHALARHVASDGRVVGLTRDLVDFVDVHDANLSFFDIVVAFLKQFLDDVLDVFTYVTGFGQRGGIGDGEGHIKQTRERFRQKRFTGTGRTNDQNVALAQLNVIRLTLIVETLVVVVHRYGENLFGLFLTNDVFVEDGADLGRRRQLALFAVCVLVLDLFTNDVVAEVHALVAD